MRCARVMCV
jgi:hypothetical protein